MYGFYRILYIREGENMQVIYIDLLFILNLVMDMYIFSLACIIRGKKVKVYRIGIASVIAALLYCLSLIIPILSRLPFNCFYFILPVLSILYLFKPESLMVFLKSYLTCLVIAWAIGGIGFYLYYYTLYWGMKTLTIAVPLLSGAILWGISYFSITWLKSRRIQLVFDYEIELRHQSKSAKLNGFLDSGNQLYTLDGQFVTIVDSSIAKRLFNAEWVERIKKLMSSGSLEALIEEKKGKYPIYLVPFESIGCKQGVLVACEVDEMIVKRKDVCWHNRKCIIAIAPETLFQAGGYEALLHPEMITIK